VFEIVVLPDGPTVRNLPTINAAGRKCFEGTDDFRETVIGMDLCGGFETRPYGGISHRYTIQHNDGMNMVCITTKASHTTQS
jgi:hypothetical protein